MSVKCIVVILLAACLFIDGAPARVGAAEGSAAALLAKHAAYAGWQGGDGKIKTLREIGEATRDGKSLTHLSRLAIGQIYRSSGTRTIGSFENGFTGRVFWQSNENGFTTQTVGEGVKYLATLVQIDDEELTTLSGSLRGNETIAGVQTSIVRVVAQAGLPVDLYIDSDSGAYKRIAIDPDGRYEMRIDVLADTDVGGGKRVRSSWRYVGGKTVYSWTKIDANTDIAADELHPPKQHATWTFGPAAQTVPIALTDKRIFLDATVNGHPGHFIFDTGASGIVFTDSFARSVGAKRVGETSIAGVGRGSARANVFSVDTLAFGANVLHDVVVFSGLDERLGSDAFVDGLVGFDLLAGAVVEMDLDAKTMRIHDPALVAPDHSQGVTIRVDLSTGQPRVPMTLNDHTPVVALLDSGNPLHVLFSSKLVARGHVQLFTPPNSLAARLAFFGVNGDEVDDCGRLASLELGPIAYRPVPACESDSMSSNEILVGLDFLKAFNFVFDYPDGEIVLTPRK